MILKIDKRYENELITIPVRTAVPQRICARVSHDNKPYTVYFDSSPVIKGVNEFKIKIPKSPDDGVILELYNEANGHLKNDPTFQIKPVQVSELAIPIPWIANKTTRAFIDFSDDFCEDAGIIPAQNNVYVSPDGRFRIDYKEVIRNDKGDELTTPARINADTGLIEIARKHYLGYTVAGRRATNLHEHSHLYRNKNVADEFEADRNMVILFLGSGGNKIEAINVFSRIFINHPTDLNKARQDAMIRFIENFDDYLYTSPFIKQAA